ncbi:putative UDP-N-acetylglucosamine--peptide N-acetylglucosaminyltransferase SPINDLY [Geobacter sp. OR-1]|uniref:O-linked N-acetylglucosamine transferase, SPINDLY family protein n=1 Tax=Geobacter sp. OR-1 TaxID=1266765 RepID=UPI000542FC0E|nr:tetratricopeptide repeat protein [Geobacter sp. OR-1]GAM08692.1 putative UDP-N-acetylglucosamine--peptide N-acetylglucosaminyltransferase SPINDLY [Geobacter sp. OR-1]
MTINRNDPCSCGSGLKFKKCCYGSSSASANNRLTDLKAAMARATDAHKSGRLAEASTVYRTILVQQPKNGDALHLLGVSEFQQGNNAEAIELIQKAIPLMPGCAEAYINLGTVYHHAARLDEAISCFRKALEIAPNNSVTLLNLGNTYKDQMALDQALSCYRQALAIRPDFLVAHSNILMILQYDPLQTPATLADAHQQWDIQHGHPLQPYTQYKNSQTLDRPIRVGYLSPDFCNHPVGYFMLPVVKTHDRSRVTTYCYYNKQTIDNCTEQLQNAADVWHFVKQMSDQELARLIRTDEIDILVDLAGHTANNRLPVFALKPAPVQVSWLGYPCSTGLKAIDYRLTDRIADPTDEDDRHASETLLRLPDSFLCYEPPATSPDVAPLPARGSNRITFGSFNNLAKVNDRVIALWASILSQLPGSRLVLKSKAFADPMLGSRLLERFRNHGLESSRIELRSFTASIEDHYRSYNEIDIALDTFPYNGTTTTFDALWMGVPVITLRGARHAARVGASILTHAGLEDLIADSEDAYVASAVRLANDLNKLEALRQTVRNRVAGSRLCDVPAFTASLEEAYHEMMSTWIFQQKEQREVKQ